MLPLILLFIFENLTLNDYYKEFSEILKEKKLCIIHKMTGFDKHTLETFNQLKDMFKDAHTSMEN